jgi:formamidopyrimidine-DNA glycosylase (fpg)
MPELPEVETIVRSLQNPSEWAFAGSQTLRERPGVAQRRVTSVNVAWERTLATPDLATFSQKMSGAVIQSVTRRGKFVVMPLSDGVLLFHLRMSGDLRVEEQLAALLPHDRLWLNFEDGARLVFNDTRKFGRAWLVEEAKEVLGDLGPEPLDPQLSAADLLPRWQKSGRAIKTLLLDQTILAGVGNIYSDEALFLAGIHPLTPGTQMTPEKSEKLLEAIRAVLNEGIRRNGASIDWVYRGGDFQNYFSVYQRTGEPCKVCGTPIERLVIGQRSSHFCPVCQR